MLREKAKNNKLLKPKRNKTAALSMGQVMKFSSSACAGWKTAL